MRRHVEETSHIRERCRSLTKENVRWDSPATNFLIIHKETDSEFFTLRLLELIIFLRRRSERLDLPEYRIGVYPKNIDVDSHSIFSNITFYQNEEAVEKNYDLILTLGGDGTVLLAAWLFQDHVPPIVPFHFGTLGFLTVFNWDGFENRLETILTQGCRFNSRMRLTCSVLRSNGLHIAEYSVLNEIVIERGASPYMSVLNIYGDDRFLTTVQADGVAIATPTGSTAYSLSAGGSVVHPDVSAILVTPICPHSLSFRPLIVPDGLELRVEVSETNRGNVWASFDGRARLELAVGDKLIVRPSSYSVPTLCRDNQTSDWFHSLSKTLHWNER